LTDVFNERTYRLLRVIRDDRPASIREPARLVGRDKKSVHAELTPLEAVGAVRFESEGAAKRPVLPYDDLESPRTDRSGVRDTEGVRSREFSGTIHCTALIEVGRIQQQDPTQLTCPDSSAPALNFTSFDAPSAFVR
jgi:hypothetical protein